MPVKEENFTATDTLAIGGSFVAITMGHAKKCCCSRGFKDVFWKGNAHRVGLV